MDGLGAAASRTGLAALFDLVPLPDRAGPVCFAIALPSERLQALPGFPAAATPEAGRLASGRGLTTAGARASALGEATELASACAWGDEAMVAATLAEIGPAALAPETLSGFTPRQIARRDVWNARWGSFDWRPPAFDVRRGIDWMRVEDAFGGPPVFAPADAVLIGRREAGDEDAVAIADSSGCAAGASAEAARLAAVLELVERDATARWWHGGRRRAPAAVTDAGLPAALAAFLDERERRTVLFDITSDLDLPVAAAVSAEADGRDVALGFAASLEVGAAATSAATEMLQMELALAAARELGRQAADWWAWRRRVTMRLPPLDAAERCAAGRLVARAPVGGLAGVLEALARARVPVWTVDLMRPAVGVPVVRALSTALCPVKPRFARSRLRAADPRDESQAAVGLERRVPLVV